MMVKQKLLRLFSIIIFLSFAISLSVFIYQIPSLAKIDAWSIDAWSQNTDGWIEWYTTDAPSILIDSTFHRSTYRSYWWPTGNNIMKTVPANSQPIYISMYIPSDIPNPQEFNWLSWGNLNPPRGWKIVNIENSGADVTVGIGDEGRNGDKEEYCKIVITDPSSTSDVTLSQEGIFLDQRSYELSITAQSDVSRTMVVNIYDDDGELLLSQSILTPEPIANNLILPSWETYKYTFNYTDSEICDNARIEIIMGLPAGIIKFDEISLVPLNTDIAPPPPEPAGRHGFLKVDENGDYYFADNRDKKVKFFGASINIFHPFPEAPPTHRDSELLAERLAFQGYNVARLQGLERVIYTPYVSTSQMDSDKLDRLDYLIYQLKEHGIYTIIETLGSRTDRVGDNLPEAAELIYADSPAVRNMLDPVHIDIIKNFIKEFLSDHINPYTHKTYLDDAVNQWIIIANETSLPYAWASQKLNGPKFCPPATNSRLLPERYSNQLNDMWNNYLLEKYGAREALVSAWGESSATSQPQIGGADLIWDSDFAMGGFTNSNPWQNDFWACTGSRITDAQIVPLTAADNPPPGINSAVKITLSNNAGPGNDDLYNAKISPTPSNGIGFYRYNDEQGLYWENTGGQPFNLKANNSYVLSFWAKAHTVEGEDDPLDELYCWGDGLNNLSSEANIPYVSYNVTLSSEWQKYALAFTPSTGSSKVTVNFLAGGKGNGDLYITGVHLYERGNNATQDFSFESGISGGLWNYDTPDGTFVVFDNYGLVNDQHSLKIIAGNQSEPVVVSQGGLDMREGQWYTLAFYADVPISSPNPDMAVSIFDGTTQIMPDIEDSQGNIMNVLLKNGWHYYWIPFKAQNTGVNCTLKFTFNGTSGVPNVYYLDQVKLIGSNQLRNGDFNFTTFINPSNNAAGWDFYSADGRGRAQVSGSPGNRYCRITTVATPPDNINIKKAYTPFIDNVRLEQGGISLEAGRTYTVRFKAKAGVNRNITVKVPAVGYEHNFTLNTEWKEFTNSFKVNTTQNVLSATLAFCFGGNTNYVDITDIAIEDEGELLGLAENEEPFVPQVIRYINFQPATWGGAIVPDVVGYEIDHGEPYAGDTSTEGRGFGWVGTAPLATDFVSGCGLPNVPAVTSPYSPDKDTTAVRILNDPVNYGHWKIKLAPGKYLVSAACGDPRISQPYPTNNYLSAGIGNTVFFNGNAAYQSSPPAVYAIEKEVETDSSGYLNLRIGEGSGGYTALRYLIIKQALNSNNRYIVRRPLFCELPFLTKNKANDIIEFYRDIENNFYGQISDYLKQLGAKQQIISTQNYWSLTELENQASFDATAGNEYWNYVSYDDDCKAMLKYRKFNKVPLRGAILLGAKGKPFLTTEYNEMFPDHFRAEGLAMKSAYNALQGADMLVNFVNWHTYYDRLSGIDSNNSPSFYGMCPVISRMITRDDVNPAINNIELSHTQEEVLNDMVKYGNGIGRSLSIEGGMPLELSLVTGVKHADFKAPYSKTTEDYTINGQSIDEYTDRHFPYSKGGANPDSEWFISDTNQLQWNPIDGIFTLNTPNTQIMVGYLNDADKVENASSHLDNLAIDGAVITTGVTVNNYNLGFANISLTSLTNLPISASPKLLLSLTSRETNTEQTWTTAWSGNPPFFTNPTDLAANGIGHPPVYAEPVRAKIKITVGSPGYPGVKVYKLNPLGQRLAEVAQEHIQFTGGEITIDLSPYSEQPEPIEGIWYVIERGL